MATPPNFRDTADLPNATAWNNFVMRSQPDAYDTGSDKRAAALACRYMGLANNGGISSFLTSSSDLDASEVLEALTSVGAFKAAEELRQVLGGLGVPVPPSSQEDRFKMLERHWTDALDEHDLLSDEADRDLMRALERHVREHEAFYLALNR